MQAFLLICEKAGHNRGSLDKRLQYLPNVLNVVATQDYRDNELVVSDYGMNGSAVPEL